MTVIFQVAIPMHTDGLPDDNFLSVLTWLSPSFPVGGYVYSHSIEFAVEDSRITNEKELCVWIESILRFGAGRIDGALLCFTWRAIIESDYEQLRWAVNKGNVMRSSFEMGLESKAQGNAFIDTIVKSCPMERLTMLLEENPEYREAMSYSNAVGLVCAIANISLRVTLLAYYHSVCSNLVSAGIRLIPLGKVAGQKCMKNLTSVIIKTVDAAISGDFNDLGTANPIIDWASMKHETQYTRLFRS